LWKDSGIKKTFESKKVFADMDNTPYFFERVQQYAQPNYKTTFEDYVRVRDRTVGIVTTKLRLTHKKHEIHVNVTDVGGQRSERRKWLPLFDGANVVVWVMSLASYDQMLYENNTVNRFDEAFNLFAEYCHHKHFANTEFVVFMNKKDIFEKKLSTIPFTKYDHKFDENNANNSDEVINYVQKRHEDIFFKKEKKSCYLLSYHMCNGQQTNRRGHQSSQIFLV